MPSAALPQKARQRRPARSPMARGADRGRPAPSRSKAYRKTSREPLRPEQQPGADRSRITPSGSHTTPSPSIVTDLTRERQQRLGDQRHPVGPIVAAPGEHPNTDRRTRRHTKRYPSCLISYAHSGPQRHGAADCVGRHGSNEAGRAADGARVVPVHDGGNTRRGRSMRILGCVGNKAA